MSHHITFARQRQRMEVLGMIQSITESDVRKPIREEDLQRQTGIDPESLKKLLAYLHEKRWVRLSCNFESNLVYITIEGLEFAENLKIPWWQRWWNDPGIRAAIVASILTSVLSGISTFAALALFHWLFP